MTSTVNDDEVTLASVAEQLDGLTDLFKRRLLDDRAKQTVIEDLQARLTHAENVAAATALKPLVDSIALVIERMKGATPTAELVTSICSELEYVLEAVVGVAAITATSGDPVDRLRHEITSASGEGTDLCVDELIRVGYEKDGVILRPARISAIRSAAETGDGSGGNE